MKKTHSIICLLIGLFGLFLVYDHISGFTPHDYFYINNPDIEKYIGTNVVSMFADFSFFTYHTAIFFSLWLVLVAGGGLLRLDGLVRFLKRDGIVTFVCLNYFITVVLYTVFELTSGNITFGLYATHYKGIYNFVTNILMHYAMAAVSLMVFIKVRVEKTDTSPYKAVAIPLAYLLVYFAVVKVTGMYCYRIIWYPYPIFDGEALRRMLHLNIGSPVWQNVILAAVLALLAFGYAYAYTALLKLKRKTAIEP